MILKYDLESHEMSVIDLPHIYRHVLITTVDGGLGFATLHESKLYMWSRKDGLGVDAGWTQNRVIDLEMLLRSNAILTLPDVVGIADEIGVIFLRTRTDNALFTFDLKTYKVKKICEGRIFDTIFPYMNFYAPGTAYLGFVHFLIFSMRNVLVTNMKSRLNHSRITNLGVSGILPNLISNWVYHTFLPKSFIIVDHL